MTQKHIRVPSNSSGSFKVQGLQKEVGKVLSKGALVNNLHLAIFKDENICHIKIHDSSVSIPVQGEDSNFGTGLHQEKRVEMFFIDLKDAGFPNSSTFGIEMRGWTLFTVSIVPDFVARTWNLSIMDHCFEDITIPSLRDFVDRIEKKCY